MKRQLICAAVIAAFTFCAPLALAQSTPAAAPAAATASSAAAKADRAAQRKQMMMRERMRMRSHRMMGRHMMPSTVNSVDHKTGLVDVTAEGLHLQVHFPPATITELKAGDKISLMLGYRMQEAPKAEKPAVSK